MKISLTKYFFVGLLLLFCVQGQKAFAASQPLEYDANGNLISGKGKFYEYNDANKLVMVREGSKEGPVIVQYWYDYQGQRVKKVENGITTYYIGKQYEERKGPSTNEKTNFYFAGGQRVARKTQKDNKPAETFYYLNNHLGSPEVVTNASGAVVDRLEYFPYGSIRNTGSERYSYTGKEKDAGTGQFYYEARYYDPLAHHFTQADTVTPDIYNPQELNRYSYVNNNPINKIDPNGESGTYYNLVQNIASEAISNTNIDTDSNYDEIINNFSIETTKAMAKAPSMKIVKASGYLKSNGTYVPSYYRTAPNAIKSGASNIGLVISPALQAAQDSFRGDLSGGQKLGRTSVSILPGIDSAGSATMLAIKEAHNFKVVRNMTGLEKNQTPSWDQAKADFFSNKNPVVDKTSNFFRSTLGDKWLLKQNWIDAF